MEVWMWSGTARTRRRTTGSSLANTTLGSLISRESQLKNSNPAIHVLFKATDENSDGNWLSLTTKQRCLNNEIYAVLSIPKCTLAAFTGQHSSKNVLRVWRRQLMETSWLAAGVCSSIAAAHLQLEHPNPILGCLGLLTFQLRATNSSFLQRHTLRHSSWWLKSLGPCYPHRKQGLNFSSWLGPAWLW